MTEQLKPCPFCGGVSIFLRDHHMCCHVCGAEGSDGDSSHESEAIEAWNRRAQPAQAGHVPEASCGECGKKASDGWALYCVACMEKAGLPGGTGSPPLTHSCTSGLGKTPDSTAQAVPVLSGDEISDIAMQSGAYDEQLLAFARLIEQAVRAKMGVAGWIATTEQMPEPGTECLVCVKALSPKQEWPTHYTHIDTWDEQHEAPVSWSSATIPVGFGWGSFEFEDVTHWMPLPPPPGIVGKEGA